MQGPIGGCQEDQYANFSGVCGEPFNLRQLNFYKEDACRKQRSCLIAYPVIGAQILPNGWFASNQCSFGSFEARVVRRSWRQIGAERLPLAPARRVSRRAWFSSIPSDERRRVKIC